MDAVAARFKMLSTSFVARCERNCSDMFLLRNECLHWIFYDVFITCIYIERLIKLEVLHCRDIASSLLVCEALKFTGL